MPRHQDARDVLVAFVAALATAAGLIALTPLPRPIALTSALLLGTGALATDIFAFDRPVQRKTRTGRWALGAFAGVAALSALLLAFLGGQDLKGSTNTYTFIVTNADGGLTLIKSVPYEGAQTDQSLSIGDVVEVECSINQGHHVWYKLAEDQGWLRSDELIPAPHTGEGSPPTCPN